MSQSAELVEEAEAKLHGADLRGAHDSAHTAIDLLTYYTDAPAEAEVLVRSLMVEALASAYENAEWRAAARARQAVMAAHAELGDHPLTLQAELVSLHVYEMGRTRLATATRGFWDLGQQLANDDYHPAQALRAFSRLMACAIWSGDLELGATARKLAAPVAARIDDPDDLGSHQIWCAQLAVLEHNFDVADVILELSLELRADTERRAITDLYAGALLELERGHLVEGHELATAFIGQARRAGLTYYANVGETTLLPKLG